MKKILLFIGATIGIFFGLLSILIGIFFSICGGFLWNLDDTEGLFIIIEGVFFIFFSIFISLFLSLSPEHRTFSSGLKLFLRSIFIMVLIFLCIAGLLLVGLHCLQLFNLNKNDVLLFSGLFIACIGIIKILK